MDKTIRVGRINPRWLSHVSSQRVDSGIVTYSGRVAGRTHPRPTTLELGYVRDQLFGMASNLDEPFVPLIDEKNPSLTGMVRVRDVTVDIGTGDLDDVSPSGGEFELVLERVGAQPNVESLLVGGWRETSEVTSSLPTAWHAVPAAAIDYFDGVSTFQSSPVTRATETGNVYWFENPGFGDGVVGATVARFSVPEANWYDGAACIEMQHAPGEWHTVIGRHLAPVPAPMVKARSWRLTNGAVRVYPSATGGTIEVQAWSGSPGSWGTPKVLLFEAADGVGGYEFNRIHTVAVRRNSPEECKLRLTVGMTAGGLDYQHRVVLDLSLRRGDRVVDGRLSTAGQAMLGAVSPAPGEAGSVLAGGGRTNPAINGNRFVLFTPAPTSFNTGTSSLYSAGSGDREMAWSFGVGWEIGASGAAYPERVADLRNQYFAPFSERMHVVGW